LAFAESQITLEYATLLKKHGSAAVEEVRVRQRELAFQTLYKRKIRKP
jgi:hypothetical protein